MLNRIKQLMAERPDVSYLSAVEIVDAEVRAERAALYGSAMRALADDAIEAQRIALRDGGDAPPILPGLGAPAIDGSIMFRRGRLGAVEVDLAATTTKLMRDKPFLSHADAQNEACVLARGLRGPRAPDPVMVLARDLADAGVRSDDAQNVALAIVRAGSDPERFDAARYADAREAGTEHGVAMRDAWL